MVVFDILVVVFIMEQASGAPGMMGKPNIRASTGSSSAKRSNKADPIVFPVEPPYVAPCKNGKTFCSEYDDKINPSKYLKNIPADVFARFNSFFVNDTLTAPSTEVATRFDGVHEMTLCSSTEELTFPSKAVAVDSQTKVIVNAGNYLQGIRVEVCSKSDSPCLFNESFPNGYTTVCRQKFITRKLVVVDPTNNMQTPLSTSDFLFPSCCVCKVVVESRHARDINSFWKRS